MQRRPCQLLPTSVANLALFPLQLVATLYTLYGHSYIKPLMYANIPLPYIVFLLFFC